METRRSPPGAAAVAATAPHLLAQATLPAGCSPGAQERWPPPLPALGRMGGLMDGVVRKGQPVPLTPHPHPHSSACVTSASLGRATGARNVWGKAKIHPVWYLGQPQEQGWRQRSGGCFRPQEGPQGPEAGGEGSGQAWAQPAKPIHQPGGSQPGLLSGLLPHSWPHWQSLPSSPKWPQPPPGRKLHVWRHQPGG